MNGWSPRLPTPRQQTKMYMSTTMMTASTASASEREAKQAMYGRRVLGAFSSLTEPLTDCTTACWSSRCRRRCRLARSSGRMVCGVPGFLGFLGYLGVVSGGGPTSPVSYREEKLREIDSGCNVFPERGIQSSASQRQAL